MDDHTLYTELKRFLNGPLWIDVLHPKMQAWADGKKAAMQAAKTPADLWDARTASNTADEAIPLIRDALEGLRRKLAHETDPPARAM